MLSFDNTADIRNGSIGVDVPGAPAIYRLELTFRDASSTVLGRYGEYRRVMPRRVAGELRTDSHRYLQGDVIRARLFNLGTVQLVFGEGFAVEAFDGSSWSAAPRFPLPPVKKRATALNAGAVGRCEVLPIAMSVPDGAYRLVKRVSPLLGMRRFRVTSPRFHVGTP